MWNAGLRFGEEARSIQEDTHLFENRFKKTLRRLHGTSGVSRVGITVSSMATCPKSPLETFLLSSVYLRECVQCLIFLPGRNF